jgi:hypothetical protein
MEPKGYIPVFDDMETLAEIDIRGRFIMMACDLEFTLLHIMMHCAPDPMNQIRRFNSDEMRMHNKIECTISDLKKYKPHLYEAYKDDLEKLWEFKIVRNDLAHLKLLFDKNSDFKLFKFLLIQDDENGKERLHYKPYSIEYLKECLIKFVDLNMALVKLVEKLQAELPSSPAE